MISVVLPACNEEAVIGAVLKDLEETLKALKEPYEIWVVNDGSTDRTGDIARRCGARVVDHPYNIGNGAAIKTGIRHSSGDKLIFMDSDGQHDPREIPALLKALESYDMVVGARFDRSTGTVHRNLANRLYNALAGYVTGQHIPDLTSGYRAVRAEVARKFLYLLPNTFSYPTTITLACFRAGHAVHYHPIQVRVRTGHSKIRLLTDGARFGLIILKIATFFAPFRIFLPLSLIAFAGGAANYFYTYFTERRFTNMSALMFITASLIFLLGLISDQIASLRFDRSEDLISRSNGSNSNPSQGT